MAGNRMVITINREEGSGGREIAQKLAKSLKFTYVDNQILQQAAKHLGIPEEDCANLDGRVLPSQGEVRKLARQYHDIPLSVVLAPARDIFSFREQHKVEVQSETKEADQDGALLRNYHSLVEQFIREIARPGGAVILGRAANFVLRGWPGVVNVFVHAPLPERVERLAYLEQISQEEAARRIEQGDGARAEYIRHYYQADWKDPDHYQLVINTAGMSLSTATEAVCSFVKQVKYDGRNINRLDIHRTYDWLANRQSYSVEEAADLFLVSPFVLRQAVYKGKLKGTVVDHRVVGISRAALLDWLQEFRSEERVRGA